MSDCQKAFEKWMSDNYNWPQTLEKRADGGYKLMQSDQNWKAWKAAWEAKSC